MGKKRDWEKKDKSGKGENKDGKRGKGHGKGEKHGKGHGKEEKHGKGHGKHGKDHGKGEKHEKNGITHSKYFLPAVIGGSVLVACLLCCLGRYCYNRKKVVSTVPTYPQDQEGTYVMDVETMGNETGGAYDSSPVYQP